MRSTAAAAAAAAKDDGNTLDVPIPHVIDIFSNSFTRKTINHIKGAQALFLGKKSKRKKRTKMFIKTHA